MFTARTVSSIRYASRMIVYAGFKAYPKTTLLGICARSFSQTLQSNPFYLFYLIKILF